MRVPNCAYTKLQRDREWHRESWVGMGERGRAGWPARTYCGIELDRDEPRVRKLRIPEGAVRCAGCFR